MVCDISVFIVIPQLPSVELFSNSHFHQQYLRRTFPIPQARILEWVGIPFSRGSSQPRDWPQVSCHLYVLFCEPSISLYYLPVMLLVLLLFWSCLCVEDICHIIAIIFSICHLQTLFMVLLHRCSLKFYLLIFLEPYLVKSFSSKWVKISIFSMLIFPFFPLKHLIHLDSILVEVKWRLRCMYFQVAAESPNTICWIIYLSSIGMKCQLYCLLN